MWEKCAVAVVLESEMHFIMHAVFWCLVICICHGMLKTENFTALGALPNTFANIFCNDKKNFSKLVSITLEFSKSNILLSPASFMTLLKMSF